MCCTSSAAASAAFAKASRVGGALTSNASAAAMRVGRSVAALTAIRASVMTFESTEKQTAAPTVGQSSAERAVNFSYQQYTPGDWPGTSTAVISSSFAREV